METTNFISFKKAIQKEPELTNLLLNDLTRDEGVLRLSRKSGLTQTFINANISEITRMLNGNEIYR